MWQNRSESERRREGKRTIFKSIFMTSIISILILVLLSVCAISIIFVPHIIRENGKSRVAVLQQIHSTNIMNRKTMVNMADAITDDFLRDLLTEDKESEILEEKVEDLKNTIAHSGLSLQVNILMNDKRTFSTDGGQLTQQLKNSYWYIKHYTGEVEESWNLCYIDEDDGTHCGLSYGRTLFDENGLSSGVLIITSMDQELFGTLNDLVQGGNSIYILDQNGIIIGHTNSQLIGNWKANMDTFESTYAPYNSFKVKEKNGTWYLISDYHDADSGWTYVEEQKLSIVLGNSVNAIWLTLAVILVGTLLISMINYRKIRSITEVLEDFSNQLGSMSADDLRELPVSHDYEEVELLGLSFNNMFHKIQALIEQIRVHEKEKRKTEYDFLQAQLDPHFLNNTLVAIKSLIAMNQMDQARCMMEQLIELLSIPATPEIQFVSLREEIKLIEDYLAIMNCRTAKQVELRVSVDPEAEQFLVPRMILQPIVGNSVFHGFAEQFAECQIMISAHVQEETLLISVTDNGEGIESEKLKKLREGTYETTQDTHHGIGLRNIQKRLDIIYGYSAELKLYSTVGEGTRVVLRISDRDEEV